MYNLMYNLILRVRAIIPRTELIEYLYLVIEGRGRELVIALRVENRKSKF
jgi:hypothetical protein